MPKIFDSISDPVNMVRIHKWLLFLWIVPGVPISFLLMDSVPWLVFLSVYAIFATHWSGWQSGRTEVKQDESNE